jgi:hypothetical protein
MKNARVPFIVPTAASSRRRRSVHGSKSRGRHAHQHLPHRARRLASHRGKILGCSGSTTRSTTTARVASSRRPGPTGSGRTAS